MSTTDNNFNAIAKRQVKKKPPPFSLRLTFEERSRLEELAGDEPLGSYIKRKLFDGHGASHKRARSKLRRPVKDDASLAKVLALLGSSRIANNLNQLAKAVNIGSLPVVTETEHDILRAWRSRPARREGDHPPCTNDEGVRKDGDPNLVPVAETPRHASA